MGENGKVDLVRSHEEVLCYVVECFARGCSRELVLDLESATIVLI